MDLAWLRDVLLTGLGALLGALCAFELERFQRKRELAATRIEAGYRALMTLGMMRDHARGLYDGLLKRDRGKPHAWFSMPAMVAFPAFEYRLEVDTLAFLLATGRLTEMQALQDAVHAEHEFYSWRDALAARNLEKLHSMELLSRSPNPRGQHSDEELEQIFGRSLKKYLEVSATALPPHADKVLQQLRQALGALHGALNRYLPGHTFQFPNEQAEGS
jgi:hypothetical protein